MLYILPRKLIFMFGGPWRWRWGLRGPGRPPKHRIIRFRISRVLFMPMIEGTPVAAGEPIVLNPDEIEALRLVYLEGRTQEDAARLMNISRGTLWRALSSGRRKLIQALVEIRPILISGE